MSEAVLVSDRRFFTPLRQMVDAFGDKSRGRTRSAAILVGEVPNNL